MKKVVLLLMAMMLLAVNGAWAVPMNMNFTEQFLGSKTDNNYFELQNGWSSSFGFDLTGQGAEAVLRNAQGAIKSIGQPTIDVIGFVPSQMKVLDADLLFTISSNDLVPEDFTIKAGIFDGNVQIFEKVFALGKLSWTGVQRQYADVEIDLLDFGLENYLNDGKFLAIALAPNKWYGNDLRIDMAELSVEAVPVPEPGTIVLFSGGLFSLVVFAKRRQKMQRA